MCYVCMLDLTPSMLKPLGCLGSWVDKISAMIGLPFELSMQGASEADIARLVGSLGEHIEQPHSANLAAARSLELWHARALPPAVCQLTQLTALRLGECSSLTRLPDSVGNLAQLQELQLWDCSSLAQLPDSIGQLTKLTQLQLWSCSSLAQLPDSIGQLAQLQELRLDGCSSLAQLPDSIGQMTQLQWLWLDRCSSLAQLPDNIGQLAQLQMLSLTGCSSLAGVPDGIGQLAQLTELSLRSCSGLAALPATFTSLTSLRDLNLIQCTKLGVSAGLANLAAPNCQVRVYGCAFVRDCGTQNVVDMYSWRPLASIQGAMQQVLRTAAAKQSLLSDRDARRASLDSISVVAVLLATAAFVAFAQAPGVPGAFGADNRVYGAPGIERQTIYLRLFFVADQATFVFSMSVVLMYLVSSLPRCSVADDVVEAAHVWTGYFVASLLLGIAVSAGMTAFVFAAYAGYAPSLVDTDVVPFWVLAIVIVALLVIKWGSTLYRLYPGRSAMWQYFLSWFKTKMELRSPVQGTDESAHQILQELQEMKEQAKLADEARKAQAAEQQKHAAAQTERLLQEQRVQAEKMAAEQKAQTAQMLQEQKGQTEQLLQEQRAQADRAAAEQRAWAERLLNAQEVRAETQQACMQAQLEALREQRAQAAEHSADMRAQLAVLQEQNQLLRDLLQARPGGAPAAFVAAPADGA